MNANGQTLNDRLLAARHSLAGQGLAKAVCKATTEELISPKKKHLDCKPVFSCVNLNRHLTDLKRFSASRVHILHYLGHFDCHYLCNGESFDFQFSVHKVKDHNKVSLNISY